MRFATALLLLTVGCEDTISLEPLWGTLCEDDQECSDDPALRCMNDAFETRRCLFPDEPTPDPPQPDPPRPEPLEPEQEPVDGGGQVDGVALAPCEEVVDNWSAVEPGIPLSNLPGFFPSGAIVLDDWSSKFRLLPFDMDLGTEASDLSLCVVAGDGVNVVRHESGELELRPLDASRTTARPILGIDDGPEVRSEVLDVRIGGGTNVWPSGMGDWNTDSWTAGIPTENDVVQIAEGAGPVVVADATVSGLLLGARSRLSVTNALEVTSFAIAHGFAESGSMGAVEGRDCTSPRFLVAGEFDELELHCPSELTASLVVSELSVEGASGQIHVGRSTLVVETFHDRSDDVALVMEDPRGLVAITENLVLIQPPTLHQGRLVVAGNLALTGGADARPTHATFVTKENDDTFVQAAELGTVVVGEDANLVPEGPLLIRGDLILLGNAAFAEQGGITVLGDVIVGPDAFVVPRSQDGDCEVLLDGGIAPPCPTGGVLQDAGP